MLGEWRVEVHSGRVACRGACRESNALGCCSDSSGMCLGTRSLVKYLSIFLENDPTITKVSYIYPSSVLGADVSDYFCV